MELEKQIALEKEGRAGKMEEMAAKLEKEKNNANKFNEQIQNVKVEITFNRDK